MFALCRVCIIALLTGWLCISAVETSASAQQWSVGFARQKITPEQPMWMSGYGARDRPAEGKLTDLWAKAMVLSDADDNRFVLLTFDLVGIDRDTASRITTAAKQRYQLPRHAIVLSTTHTHSGPVVGENLKAMYFLDRASWRQIERYTSRLVDSTVDLIGRAIEAQTPANLSWTVGQANFAVNRRNNPENEVPDLRSAGKLRGPVDFDVPILVIHSPSARPSSSAIAPDEVQGIICGYACHATVLSGYQWCGDWPGYAQQRLQERFPGATAMVWAGCGADINPLPRRQVELAEQYGAEIDRAVATALEQPIQLVSGELDAKYEEILLPFSQLPTRQQLEQQLSSENRYEAGRSKLLLEQWDRDGELSKTYPYPVQSWQLGDGPTWIFLGGEVVVDYSLKLKSEIGHNKCWVTAYSNDVMAYIASRRVIKEGGYEGGGAMLYYGLPGPWAESIEQQILETVRAQVAELGDKQLTK